MECKSCGSVKFKKVQYGLYECEYCGRQVEIPSVLRADNTMNNMFIDDFGYIMLDPTRIFSFKYEELDRERKMLELQMEIEKAKIKDDTLQKQCSNLKRFLAKIKRRLQP